MNDLTNIFAITKQCDASEEEYVYSVGRDEHVPIMLLVLIASGARNAVERYLSIYAGTKTAINLTKELLEKNHLLEEKAKELADFFDERDSASQEKIRKKWEKEGMPVFKGFSSPQKNIGEQIKNYPRDAVFDFHMYAAKLAECLAMITPTYASGHEGVPQVCSIGYIAFHSREEFVNMHESANKAFTYVFAEIIRIMELRNIEFNKNDMTLPMESYKTIIFREPMYPGF